MDAALVVRPLSTLEHRAFLHEHPQASFLQTPGWARVKSEWRAESIGWFRDASSLGSSTQGLRGEQVVGAGLVLYRQIPGVKRYLAYLPEGPVIDWDPATLADWIEPMVSHLRGQGAFGVRMGPPVLLRRWSAEQVKQGIADPGVRRLDDLTPTEQDPQGCALVECLRGRGWRPQGTEDGFAAGQPRFNFWLPLIDRSSDDVLAGMNQLWRRNIKKAAKAGVEVRVSTPQTLGADLAAFHELYVLTAARDGFTPRPLSYFTAMFDALGDPGGSDEAGSTMEIRLYLAHHEQDLVAATIWIRVGTHVWYSYGASSTERREVRGSNAVQWQMISDAIECGAEVYDLRGITDTLDPDDSHVGLVQFKVGTGGQAVEYAGEWDLPLRPLLYKAFDLYMSRR